MAEVANLDAADLADKLADGWMLLDVRRDDEWSQDRIEGAVHIPLDQVVARIEEIGDQVVCVCAAGARSERAAAYLINQGREAVNLDCGVFGWAAQGRPLIS